MNGARNGTFFCPTPWGLGEGSNGQISLNIIKFQLHSKFQRLFTKLCVSSQTRKNIKPIRREFHFAAWVMPQWWDLGVPWGGGGGGGGLEVIFCFPKFNQIWCVSYLHEWHMHRRHFYAPPPGALGRGQKVKYH